MKSSQTFKIKDMAETIKIEAKRPAWAVFVNTDLTEGRGAQVPLGVYESQTTAIRMGRKKDVQGCDAPAEQVTLYRIGNQWYGPVHVQSSSKEDDATDKKLELRKAAIERARLAGLSEQDIKDIYQVISIP